MAVTDRLMNDLRVSCPGASDAAIQREIWNTLNDFCREGHTWREVVEITLVLNTAMYPVAPAGTEVVHVYAVSHATLDVAGAVYQYGQILLTADVESIDTASPLFVDAALTPSLDAGADVENLIPVDMWSEHHEAIKDGVLGRMFAQPAKPFSNPSMATFYMRKYQSARSMARHKVRTGGTMGDRNWRFPRWAGRRGA